MVRRAFACRLYHSKRLRYLHATLDLAAEIHNHLIAVQKRYYRRFQGYVGYYRLKRHVTKLKGMARFAHWKQLDAQAIQQIVWRIDQGYQRFFRKENRRPPTFRKRSRYRSITLSQTGWRYAGGNGLWLVWTPVLVSPLQGHRRDDQNPDHQTPAHRAYASDLFLPL